MSSSSSKRRGFHCSLERFLAALFSTYAVATVVTFVLSSILEHAAAMRYIPPESANAARHAFHAVGLVAAFGTGVLIALSILAYIVLRHFLTLKVVRLTAMARNRLENGGSGPFGIRSPLTEMTVLSDILKRLFNAQAARVSEFVDLTTNWHHDTGTLISDIQMNARAIAESGSPEAAKGLEILTTATRLDTLLGTILGIVENYNHVTGAPLKRVDMCELAITCEELSEVQAADKDIEIELDIPDNHVFFPGHEHKLTTMLHNLVANAVKYTPEGGKVAIRMRQEGDTLRLVVEDNGPGIPAEALPHIFTRGYRAPGAEAQPGSGLGLVFVHSAVLFYDGTITPESRLGTGTKFTITLPLKGKENDK